MYGDYDQIQADEDYARRLQNQEREVLLGDEHGIVRPSSAHEPDPDADPDRDHRVPSADDQRRVQANVQANIDHAREQSPRFLLVYAIWAVLEVTVTFVILGIYFAQECDASLKLFLGVFSSRFFLSVPLRLYIFNQRRANSHDAADYASRVVTWLDFAMFAWFIVGQTWLYGSDTCSSTNPGIYYWALVLIVFIYISMALPILILVGLCLCLPCVLLVLRVIVEPQGASESVINKLPKKTYTREQLGDSTSPADTCSICRSDYATNDELRCLPCGHDFHVDCVDPWLKINTTCPLCRGDIRSSNPRATAATPASAGPSGSSAASSSSASAPAAHSRYQDAGDEHATDSMV